MVEYKIRALTNEGKIISGPFATRPEAINFISSLSETKEVRRDIETKERETII